MGKYILKRIGMGLLVLLGVVTITFFISRVLPSSPEMKWAGQRATPEQLEAARIELGLDKPLYIQYVNYLKQLLHGDLGVSLTSKKPVTQELGEYIPATLELVILTFLLSMIISVPLGVYSAKKKDRLLDHFGRLFSIGAVSLPTFWVALFLQLIFYKALNLFPLGGQMSISALMLVDRPNVTGFLLLDCLLTGNTALFWDALKHYILPCVTLMTYPVGVISRMTRSAMLEILNEDYIQAGRSYGLSETKILWKYATKNSLGTMASNITMCFGSTLMNTFLIEAIFSWPGVGNYISSSVTSLDFPAIIGVTIFGAVCYTILNLIADITVALDPRVRL